MEKVAEQTTFFRKKKGGWPVSGEQQNRKKETKRQNSALQVTEGKGFWARPRQEKRETPGKEKLKGGTRSVNANAAHRGTSPKSSSLGLGLSEKKKNWGAEQNNQNARTFEEHVAVGLRRAGPHHHHGGTARGQQPSYQPITIREETCENLKSQLSRERSLRRKLLKPIERETYRSGVKSFEVTQRARDINSWGGGGLEKISGDWYRELTGGRFQRWGG